METAIHFFDRVRTSGVLDVKWMVTSARERTGFGSQFDLSGIQISGGTLPDSIYDGRVGKNVVVLVLGMRDEPPMVVNGLEMGSGIAIGGRGAVIRAHWASDESHGGPFSLAGFVVPADLVPRGWPAPDDFFALHAVPPEAMAKLRSLVHGAFVVASTMPEVLDDPAARANIRDNILARIGEALRDGTPRDPPRIARDYMHLALTADTFLDANRGRPIYSADVAQALGVGLRTLHNVMMQINGIPLHRYIRLRRLQCVRQALLRAPAGTMVKQCALDAGFRHLGRFSTEYFEQFGEMPSDTISQRSESEV
jgi:AraC-like DNA-binding protein